MEKASHSFKTYVASCPKSNHKTEKSEGGWTKPDEKPLESEWLHHNVKFSNDLDIKLMSSNQNCF